MATKSFTPLKGHCTCKSITYEVLAPFICVHCCYCTWCQRESGSAFALNPIVETSNFRITSDLEPVLIKIPSASGDGQIVARCPQCYVCLYTHYGDDFKYMTFVKAGTLDDESRKTVKPDIHIFTSTKPDWIDLTSERNRGIPIMTEFYRSADVWSKEALERRRIAQEKMEAEREIVD